jgi:hypothetical protein
MKIIRDALFKLIEIATLPGLDEYDLKNAEDFLKHNEFGLCFETILTQMYEYEIKIDEDFYELIAKIGKQMNFKQVNYSFMKELIRDENTLPKTIKDDLARLISDLTK